MAAVALRGLNVRLAIANKAPTPQRLKANKERMLKNPEAEEEIFCIICLLGRLEAGSSMYCPEFRARLRGN